MLGVNRNVQLMGLTKAATEFSLLMALNASNAQPLTALKGTNATQVATSAVTAPFYLTTAAAGTTLQTIPAGYPVVPNSRVTWDTNLGAVLGPELVGDTALNGTGWWEVTGANITITDGIAVFNGSVPNERILKSNVSVVGKKYRATFEVKNYAAGTIYWLNGTARSANGVYTEDFFATSTNSLYIRSGGGGFTGAIDNVSFKEIIPAYLPADSLGAPLATATALQSDLTRYSAGPTGNPSLGVLCEPAATNLLLQSGFAGAVAGTPGTAPTSWSTPLFNGSIVSVTAGAIGENILEFSAVAAQHVITQQVTLATNTTYTASVVCIANSGSTFINMFRMVTTPTGSTVTAFANGVGVNATTYIPSANDVLSYRVVTAGTSGGSFIRFGVGCNGIDTATVKFTRPQYEAGSVRTNYIPTTTTTITRAARYATCNGANIGKKLRLNLVSNEVLSTAGRTTRLLSDGTRMLTYENGTGTPGLLVFRDESQVMGGDYIQSGTVLNLGGGVMTLLGGSSFTAVSNGTSGSTVRPKLDLPAAVANGKMYRLTLSHSGTFDTGTYSLYDGTAYVFQNRALNTSTDVVFSCRRGAVPFISYDGTKTFNVTAVGTIKEVAQLTYPCTLAANTPIELGLDIQDGAWKMFVDGSQVASATGSAARGTELITVAADREFSSDTGFWTKSNSTISGGVATTTGVNGFLSASILTVGKSYRARFTISGYVSGTCGLSAVTAVGAQPNANGTHVVNFVALNTAFRPFASASGVSFDNISVEEVVPDSLAAYGFLPTTYIGSSTTGTFVLNGNITCLESSNDAGWSAGGLT